MARKRKTKQDKQDDQTRAKKLKASIKALKSTFTGIATVKLDRLLSITDEEWQRAEDEEEPAG